MVALFRVIAILEGISYLALFAVTMPLKYMADLPMPNKYVGYAHGVLFIAYVVLAIFGLYRKKMGVQKNGDFLDSLVVALCNISH